jgi:NAD(P)H-hydrate epimerase
MKSRNAITLTRAQVREVDRRAIEEYGIPSIVLMENAGRGAAEFILQTLRPTGPIGIVCGGGNNGGDGFVIARHLANAGCNVALFFACDPDRLKGDAAINHQIVEKMRLPSHLFDSPERIGAARPLLHQSSIVVDALLGTGFSGPIRQPLALAIEAINKTPRSTIVAVDVPSGLDCDTGQPGAPTVRAHHTVTFVARKTGFQAAGAEEYTGEVIVVDIGAPTALITNMASGRGR